jgi:uncharacterized iron-regulated protein
MKSSAFFSACLFAIASAACHAQANEPVIYNHGSKTTMQAMFAELKNANVVFVGENHDHKQGHELELEILKGLAGLHKNQAFALEMFERDVQPVLDEYLTDVISESSFTAASRPWPNYKTDYAPLIQFCKASKIPVVASNAPRRYVSIVSRKGPDALSVLSKPAKSLLAPLPYSLEIPAEYDRRLNEIFSGAHGDSPAPTSPAMPTAENMKRSQELWDCTMADSIAKFVRKTHRPLMHINGSMHSDSGFGAMDRLRRYMPSLKVMNVTIRPSAAYPAPPADLTADTADYLIITPLAPGAKAE